MLEVIIMFIGSIVGYFLLKKSEHFRRQISNSNNILQLICVALIIFIMGINLSSIENFIQKMINLGIQSIVFAIIPTVFSVAVVYFLNKYFIIKS